VLDAARLMREHHVGNVVVVEEREGKRVPIGIVTDRDVVVEIVALGLDPGTLTIGDIMLPGLATIDEATGVFETIEFMRVKGVRRMPVVAANGALVGIVTLDDLLALLAEEFYELSGLLRKELQKEAVNRR
jgi:CBS domain-containing protein